MEETQDFFLCSGCGNKDFKPIYNFSLRFHGVNFSDHLIYDELTHEMYQCTKCQKTFTKTQIEKGLSDIKRRYKGS